MLFVRPDGALMDILSNPTNRPTLRRLKAASDRKTLVPFVGAGLSRPLGFPVWAEFLKKLGARASVDVSRELRSQRYETAAERIISAKSAQWLHSVVRRTFGASPSHDLATSPVSLLPKIAHGPVITTNFDHVLEQAYLRASHPFLYDIWGGRPALALEAVTESLHVLLKLHGDAFDSQHQVLTRSDYVREYGRTSSPTALATAIKHVASTSQLLFLGCSLGKDRYLRILKDAALPERTHFAVLASSGSDVQDDERARSLRQHGIEPIWFRQGHFLEIDRLLRWLAGMSGLEFDAHDPPPRSTTVTHNLERARQTAADIAAASSLRDKLTILNRNQDTFWRAGLVADYRRLADGLWARARDGGFPCIAFRLVTHSAAMVLDDRHKLAMYLRRAEVLLSRCGDRGSHNEYHYARAIYLERDAPRRAWNIYRRLARSRQRRPAVAALARMALLEERRGHIDRAIELIARAIQRAETMPDLQARYYNRLGLILDGAGRLPEARQAHLAALRLRRGLGDTSGLSASYDNLGTLALQRNQWRAASRLLRWALHYAQISGAETDIGEIRENLSYLLYSHAAWLRRKAADPRLVNALFEQAAEHLDESLVRARFGRRRGTLLTQRALLTFELGDQALALRQLAAAKRIHVRFRDRAWLRTNAHNRGIILLRSQPLKAAQAFSIAMSLAQAVGDGVSHAEDRELMRRALTHANAQSNYE
jgi:tetratricopeptide (TPR) repeat protein